MITVKRLLEMLKDQPPEREICLQDPDNGTHWWPNGKMKVYKKHESHDTGENVGLIVLGLNPQ